MHLAILAIFYCLRCILQRLLSCLSILISSRASCNHAAGQLDHRAAHCIDRGAAHLGRLVKLTQALNTHACLLRQVIQFVRCINGTFGHGRQANAAHQWHQAAQRAAQAAGALEHSTEAAAGILCTFLQATHALGECRHSTFAINRCLDLQQRFHHGHQRFSNCLLICALACSSITCKSSSTTAGSLILYRLASCNTTP